MENGLHGSHNRPEGGVLSKPLTSRSSVAVNTLAMHVNNRNGAETARPVLSFQYPRKHDTYIGTHPFSQPAHPGSKRRTR